MIIGKMVMNKKGQALVEFIIILPVFLMLILAVFDYVKIMQTKMSLESAIEEITLDQNTQLDSDLVLKTESVDGIKTYTLSKKVDITSPVLSAIISDTYNVKVTRSIHE
jgi:uncharacterized protein (UPF0333 family)